MLTPRASRRYHRAVESSPDTLPISTVRHVARLARLALDEAALERHRAALGAILGYVESLRELDLKSVEPLAHPLDIAARADSDTPAAPITTETLIRLAPDADPPFVKVPKVLDDGGLAG